MNPCPNCGNQEIVEEQIWGTHFYPYTNSFGFCYKCSKCLFRSEPKGTKPAAKVQWNKGNGRVLETYKHSHIKTIRRLFK